MINLATYQHPSSSFLQAVIDSKRKGRNEVAPYYKDRIILLVPRLIPAYQEYDSAFSQLTLHTVIAKVSFNSLEKADALKLYNYNSKPFTHLKNLIISRPNNYEINTCQYCTINSINTLDHIMPKDDYPEFAVHPKNLIPACSQCNSYKTNKWLNGGIFEFLNPYFHYLPLQQFLFANINYTNNTFEVSFYLSNPNNTIDAALFSIIQNHYRNLHLLERFKSKANEIISEFENTIIGNLTRLNLFDALHCARTTVQLEQARLGFNHFEAIIKLELCNGVAFQQYCKVKGY